MQGLKGFSTRNQWPECGRKHSEGSRDLFYVHPRYLFALCPFWLPLLMDLQL